MEINARFDEPVLTHTDQIDWVPSPMAGVDRRMLDRIGDEVARATSIVRYAKGSSFPEHTHSGGEEFIVLEGVFQDEHGDYPAGTYIRNPVGTHHVPGSEPGCTIFVNLWQFDPADQEQMSVDLNSLKVEPDPNRPGVSTAAIAERDYEKVSLEVWEANTEVVLTDTGGFELLILDGTLRHKDAEYARHDWIRWPAGKEAKFTSGGQGARVWIKRGHLTNITAPVK
ncbi:cupin domain-containing protein [Erythrobacter crassostreae]|uniref:Cupin domain-containing protein n=1 Tax=Erythrobacter crassostreae TaxID=2828328 RepID=A0A9X1JKW7_9SPHN|nr:cupin domain-containing protein [Erythrobacter crassostrea]MBV7259525.1 cupin domain-containing protein [Erythrobacter crassostrea]